jgi:transcriptional regulator with XRE-family HTH domain
MDDNIEGIRGEYRKPTPVEIGILVRALRDQRGIKRAALAADAHISEKSLERIEGGVGVRDETYRRIARALGFNGKAFITAAYIPTIEELAEQFRREQEEIRQTHNSVAVEALSDPRQLLHLFQSEAMIVDDHHVASKDLDAVAAFKDNLRDWSDIAADIPETARLDAARQLLADARTIERSGYEIRVGMTERYGMKGTRLKMGVVAFFATGPTAAQPSPAEVWLPKKMPMGF